MQTLQEINQSQTGFYKRNVDLWNHVENIHSDIFNKLKGNESSGEKETVSDLFIQLK